MEPKYKDPDGFTIGERLDIEIAHDANVFLLCFSDKEPGERQVISVNSSNLNGYVNDLVSLAKNEPELVQEIAGRLGYIADAVTRKLSNLNIERKRVDSYDEATEEEKQQQMDAFHNYLFDKNSCGFFLIGSDDNELMRINSGFKGHSDQISKVFSAWFMDNERKGARFIQKLDDVLIKSKRNIMKRSGLTDILGKIEPIEDFKRSLLDYIKKLRDEKDS